LRYLLVDPESKSPIVERRFELDALFSAALHNAVRRQVLAEFDGPAYLRAIVRLQLGFIDPSVLARKADLRTVAQG
jgi:hypothetical protein